MKWRTEEKILLVLMGLILLGTCVVVALTGVTSGNTSKSAAKNTKITTAVLSSAIKPVQSWSEIQIAFDERDRRVAYKAEQERLRQISESVKANDSNQNGVSLQPSNVPVYDGPIENWNPYYGGPRFVGWDFVYQLAVRYSGCGWDPVFITNIVFDHETHSGDTMADNGNGCYGLLQCNSGDGSYTREMLWNPETNFKVGASKFIGDGYGPWGH